MRNAGYFLLALLILQFPNAHADDDLRNKIGQMIMVGFYGTEIPDSLKYDIEYRNLGGIITLANNLDNPNQIQQLTENLQTGSSSYTLPSMSFNRSQSSIYETITGNKIGSKPGWYQKVYFSYKVQEF